jgi:uncharacterized protein YqhQ
MLRLQKKLPIGGQAVIEGVMMRGRKRVAVAVRAPDGTVIVQNQPLAVWSDRWPLFRLPLLRGLAALVESLTLGLRSLIYSANMAGEEAEKLDSTEMGLTIAVSLAAGTLLFIVAPAVLARYLRAFVPNDILLNVIEFAIRISFFIGYILAISRMQEIGRLFEYHGAEHKAVHAYEAGLPLTVENVQPQSTLHPRCGTSFLLIVFSVSMFFFAFLGWSNLLLRILSRIALMPLIAGVSYEIIRIAGRNKSALVRAVVYPGMLLQKLTTREPDAAQMAVAIAALQGVLEKET